MILEILNEVVKIFLLSLRKLFYNIRWIRLSVQTRLRFSSADVYPRKIDYHYAPGAYGHVAQDISSSVDIFHCLGTSQMNTSTHLFVRGLK